MNEFIHHEPHTRRDSYEDICRRDDDVYLGVHCPALAQAEIDHVNTFTRAFRTLNRVTTSSHQASTSPTDFTTPRWRRNSRLPSRGRDGGHHPFIRSDGGYVEGLGFNMRWVWSLTIEGQCEDHSQCEHAWHLIGDADYTVIRHNIARDFNADQSQRQPGDEPAICR